ncbi:MAG: ABC transporter ATP-binding protein [Bacillota bacterium]
MDAVNMQGIYKYFGDYCANKDVSFTVKKGEIHGLLGENGAGKTTLMNILYGLYSCNEGTICINSEKVIIDNPKTAIQHGIGMVHQHFMLIPQLTVTENIFLGMKETGLFLKKSALSKKVQDLNDKFGFNVNPDAYIWQLPVGIQQKVEILKALIREANILILDEPTAVLSPNEVCELFVSLRALADNGYSIILITHKIREVLTYADRVTVMRLGEVIGTTEVCKTDECDIANQMVGRSVSLTRQIIPQDPGEVLLEVKNLCVKNFFGRLVVQNVSFEVREGEIVGIAGVDGNGQLELCEAIVGGRKIESGEVLLNGADVTHKSIGFHLNKNLSHIPDDRQKKGLVLQFQIKENLIMGFQRSPAYVKGIFFRKKMVEKRAKELIGEYDVRPANIEYVAGQLSGGNQQKVIFAREIDRQPRVLIANQPTRGLDIGAIEFMRSKLIEQRKKKTAILLFSTDLDEILSLSDRILIIHSGEIAGQATYETPIGEIGSMMTGAKTAEVLPQ